MIVEVRPDLSRGAAKSDIDSLKRRLYERRVYSGLLITPARVYFLRDTLATLAFSTASYEVNELATEVLFRRTGDGGVVGDALYAQARRWLEAVAGSWSAFAPDEALPFMLPEMVGRLAHAEIEELNDVLDLVG